MKKRWFVVVLTIGLLLSVLPPSALALSPNPNTDFDTITDLDGNILDWYSLSTDPYSLDDLDPYFLDNSQEQEPPVPDLAETGSEKSLASNEATADDLNLTHDNNSADDTDSTTPPQKSLADEGRDEATAYDNDSADDTDSTKASAVCEINGNPYSTLELAVSKATEGDQIDLLTDIEMDTGLEFHEKTLTISGGGRYELTLKENGIYAFESKLTFQDLTLNLYAKEHTYEDGAGATANLISSSDLRLDHVHCTIRPEGNCGSGMYLYRNTNLYLDASDVLVDAVNGSMVDGIFADTSENYGEPNREVKITNGSYLEVRGCSYAGLMLDPIDITVSASEIRVTGNGLSDPYGGYGLACYDGKLTMEASSVIRATGNTATWFGCGVFAGELEMKSGSTLIATDNGIGGLGVGGKSVIHGGAKVFCERNGAKDPGGAGGLVVYAEHGRSIYEGDLTIESGAYVYACNNVGLAGLLNEWILNIESGATVIVDGNSHLGFANTYDARATIKKGANVSANNNDNGIYNYAGAGDQSIEKGFFLIEGGAHVTANNNMSYGICNTVDDRSYGSTDDDGNDIYTPEDDCFTIQGGADVSADGNGLYGIYNKGGIFTIENGANISTCNNGYYGILNNTHGTFTMEIGANVSVCNNNSAGIFNTNSGTFTVEENVDLQVEHNKNSGIVNNENATLTLLSGRVRYNTTSTWYGGGLRNYSTATLSDDVQLYNNHAAIGGDDIENGTTATITFGPTGRGWELDGEPDCYDFITGWYDDYETTRWNAHKEDGADLHMVLVAPVTSHTGPLSLKAAHGALSTGSLTVRKETTGELLPSDYDTAFTFELTLDDDTITTIDDQWCGIPFKNGKASFTLKSGESITLSNLPAGIGYTITEAAQDNWILMNINDAETGVVPRNDTAEVVFTNLKKSLDLPDVPILPIEPEEPEEPEIPEIPNEPEKPQTPETPEKPEGPETPKESEEPEIPEETEETEAPGELPAEEPAQADAQPEETPTQNTTAETLIQTGTTDWLAAVLLISGFGLLVCGWFFNRKQRAAKH